MNKLRKKIEKVLIETMQSTDFTLLLVAVTSSHICGLYVVCSLSTQIIPISPTTGRVQAGLPQVSEFGFQVHSQLGWNGLGWAKMAVQAPSYLVSDISPIPFHAFPLYADRR